MDFKEKMKNLIKNEIDKGVSINIISVALTQAFIDAHIETIQENQNNNDIVVH